MNICFYILTDKKTMENIILYITAKYNIFIYGFVTGAVFQYFEIQAGNVKFNIGKFIFSSCAF